MIKHIYSTVILAFLANSALAQNASTPIGSVANQANLQDLATTGISRIFDNRYEGTRGTPYYIEEFATSSISFENNSIIEKLQIKYNSFDNTILYISANGEQFFFDTNKVNKIVLEHPVLKTKVELKKLPDLVTIDQKLTNSLVVSLFEGNKIKMALHPSKDLIKADYKGSTYGASKNYDEFRDKKNYYLIKQGKVMKVKLNKKTLLDALQDKPKETSEFIATEKIDATTEQGWIKTLIFYETL